MNKLVQIVASIALFTCLIASSIHAAELNMKPGMWQWTTTMEMPGMPFAIPPVTYSVCITKKDLVPQQPNEVEQCKILENKITDSAVQWKMVCTGNEGKVVSEGKIVYTGSSAKGEIKIVTQGMTMTSKLSGQRTGACK